MDTIHAFRRLHTHDLLCNKESEWLEQTGHRAYNNGRGIQELDVLIEN